MPAEQHLTDWTAVKENNGGTIDSLKCRVIRFEYLTIDCRAI